MGALIFTIITIGLLADRHWASALVTAALAVLFFILQGKNIG